MEANQSFYWDTAKFAFSLIGGGTAGYLLAKGANAVVNKVSEVVGPKVVAKVVELKYGGATGADGENSPLTA